MKRTAILGVLLITAMSFGMAASTDTSCCGPTCMMPAFMTCFQEDQHPDVDHQRGPASMHRPKLSPKAPSNEDRNQLGRERKMPPNMVEHVMAVAKEIDPDLAVQLATICESDNDAFQKIIRRQGRRLGSLIRLREDDPDLFEVKVTELKTDAEIYHTAQALRGQDLESPESQAKIAALKGLVRAKTALTIRAQTLYIGRLEKHLAALRSKLDDTTNRFNEIVDERVEQLLNSVQDVKQGE